MDVVAFTAKDGVLAGANNHKEVAGGTAVGSGVAFAGNANALAVARAGFDAYFERFRSLDRAFPVAGRAGRDVLAGSMAARTLHVKFHPPAGLRDLPRSVALGALAGLFEKSLAMAI